MSFENECRINLLITRMNYEFSTMNENEVEEIEGESQI